MLDIAIYYIMSYHCQNRCQNKDTMFLGLLQTNNNMGPFAPAVLDHFGILRPSGSAPTRQRLSSDGHRRLHLEECLKKHGKTREIQWFFIIFHIKIAIWGGIPPVFDVWCKFLPQKHSPDRCAHLQIKFIVQLYYITTFLDPSP